MAITYKFDEPTEIVDSKQKIILAQETVTENRENRFTLAQKEEELTNAQQQVLSAQQRVKDLEAEILVIKTALNIK